MTLAAFGLLHVTESSIFGAVKVLHVFRHFIIIFIIFIIIVIVSLLLLLLSFSLLLLSLNY